LPPVSTTRIFGTPRHGAGAFQHGFGLGQLRPEVAIVDLEQRCAGLDIATFLVKQLFDDAIHAGAYLRSSLRLDKTDQIHCDIEGRSGDGLNLHHHGGNRERRLARTLLATRGCNSQQQKCDLSRAAQPAHHMHGRPHGMTEIATGFALLLGRY